MALDAINFYLSLEEKNDETRQSLYSTIFFKFQLEVIFFDIY